MTDHWNELNLRMERAFQEQKRASESRSLRDHFAAAALTGLLAQGDDGSFSEESYARAAYRWADAMLRERCRAWADCPLPDNAPNHDAAPAARADLPDERPPHAVSASGGTPSAASRDGSGTGDTQSFDAYARFAGSVMNWISEATSAADWSSDGGRKIMADACSRCWDAFDSIAYPTVHGASPEARASVDSVAPQPTTRGDSDRTDKAAPRPSEGTGDTPDSPKPIKGGVSDRSKPINGPDPDSRVWETHTPATHATHGEGSVRREGTEPVAWAVACDYGDYAVALFSDEASARTEAGRRALVGLRSGYVVSPLYRHPPCQDVSQKNLTLTDCERGAIERAVDSIASTMPYESQQGLADWKTLRGLLRRLGGGR